MPSETERTVVIDVFHDSVDAYLDGHAVVAVDVIRSMTTAITAVTSGRRCFPVPSIEAALPLAARLTNPLLVGELGGNMPYGWHMNNSPAELDLRSDVSRPMILLSTSGTRLICEAQRAPRVYAECLSNYRAQVTHLAGRWPRIALLGAGTRGEFREEDQMCCAWIAGGLVEAGYRTDAKTAALVERWREAPATAFLGGKSTEYLKDTGQTRDLDFILSHIDSVSAVFPLRDGELIMVPTSG